MFREELVKVEQPAIDQLVKLGWRYVPSTELLPSETGERARYQDVVLQKRLESALLKLNPWISEENLRKVVREFTHPNHAALMEYNQALWELMCGTGENAISVEQDLGKGRKSQTVTIIDFDVPDNNDFVCTQQFKVQGLHEAIIPDVVCFLNGLPVAVIECKSPYVVDAVSSGIDQLRRYANLKRPEDHEGAAKLFWYNQLMVSTCRDQAKVGTISSGAQHYGAWKDAYPYSDADIARLLGGADIAGSQVRDVSSPAYLTDVHDTVTAEQVNPQERLLMGLFSPDNFLDAILNFIVFEAEDGRLIKKLARYQQFRAVQKVVRRLKSGSERKEKSGVVWHTQGSGKSLTMVMLAVKMRRDPELMDYKLVFVTDRTQLDSQLSKTFRAAQRETIHNASSVSDLRKLLSNDASDIVTATVQKFQDAEKEQGFTNLNTSDRVVVLADEAHRTQFGNLAATISAALPNAPKIGFTGTPLLKTQKMDQAFGGYIDQYKINEAVDDGATVRILYEGRQVSTEVVGESLDSLFNEYFQDYDAQAKQEIKKTYGVERAVREAPARIRQICIDLLEHYRERIEPNGFKAMIVVGSRHAATVYKDILDELGAPPSEVVISGDHNDPMYLKQYTDNVKQKQAIAGFKKPLKENPTSFIIVKDMLLTGFDAPIAQVMYVDRIMKEHTLMQAIARVNRSYKGKHCGYVVDYCGLSAHLVEAMELFTSDDIEGAYHSLVDEIPKLKAAHTRVMAIFDKVKARDLDAYVLHLKDEEVRQHFDLMFKRFATQMEVVLPDLAAKPFVADLKFLGMVQNAAKNRYREPGLDISDAGEKVRALVDEHIVSTGVDPKIPPVDLLAANFKESLEGIKSSEGRAADIEYALRHHINVKLPEDPVHYQTLSERLREIIDKTRGNWELQVEMLLELVEEEKHGRQQEAQNKGLSPTELAFYNVLLNEISVGDRSTLDAELDREVCDTARHLVDMFNEITQIVDVFNKPTQIASMKKQIKRTILDCTFGTRDMVAPVQEKFLDLAKVYFMDKHR